MALTIPIHEQAQKSCEELLMRIVASKPCELFVVVVDKEGSLSFDSTGTFSRMRMVGALELLKNELMNG